MPGWNELTRAAVVTVVRRGRRPALGRGAAGHRHGRLLRAEAHQGPGPDLRLPPPSPVSCHLGNRRATSRIPSWTPLACG